MDQVNVVNYWNMIPRKNGFVFRFVKKDNSFIHTYIEGDFLLQVGMTPSMIVGKTLKDFLPESHAKEKHDYYESAWNGLISNYEGTIMGYHYLASLSPLIVDGQVVEVNGTAIDITEMRKNEIRIQEMEKLSLVGELAAGIAHEIRNPLTSIKGFTQIIKEGINDEKLKGFMDIILEELERINKIVNEFMFIAKPNETTDIREINMNSLVMSTIQFMEPQSILRNIQISFTCDSFILAHCDGNQIKQVLINLIQNAIEATTDTGKSVELALKDKDEDHFLIQVKDGGCGFSEERMKKIFQPFYSTKEKGTGLGLMICKRIIENHAGKIEIESKQGEGTVVNILLSKRYRQAEAMPESVVVDGVFDLEKSL